VRLRAAVWGQVQALAQGVAAGGTAAAAVAVVGWQQRFVAVAAG